MSDANPYQTPQSNFHEEERTGNYQTNPDWDIGAVFKEAWELTKGFKLIFWGALLIYLGISIVVSLPFEFFGEGSQVLAVISQIVVGLVTYPLGVGLSILGIKRAVGAPVSAFMVFDYYSKTIPIFLLYFLMVIMIGLGFLLLIIPGIYLAVAYSMAAPLMVEKNLRLWEALETSRKAIHKCWFSIFGLYIAIMLVLIAAMIPLGIGLIWAAPFVGIVMGVVYRSIFGVSKTI